MFILVTPELAVRLEEAQDFKRLKLVVAADRSDLAKLRRALAGIAALAEDGHAWVSEDWLRGRAKDAAWQKGLSTMIAVASKYGWVDETAKTIRAHVEWADGSSAKS